MPVLQKTRIYYDSLGRVVKTVNPNNSEQRVVFGVPTSLNNPSVITPTPWESFNYDSNDLSPITNPTDTTVNSSHYYTPKAAEVDALGRTVKTTEYFDNTDYNNTIEMNYRYDVRGNLLLVKDPYGRNVFEHVYDLRPGSKDKPAPPLKTMHIDKGTSTVLFDALGKPIESFDAKRAQTLSAYDVLQRPTNSWAKNDGSFTFCTLRNYIVYGESAATPATYNLNGKAYQSYDEAGFLETPSYDFKGNLLTKNRQVFDSATLKTYLNSYTTFIVDWTSLPSILDSTVYETGMEYDALNRITKLTLPQDLDAEQKQIMPTYNKAGALEKVDLYSPAGPTTTNYVENIAYNAKGQRLLIAFGNGAMTRYAYDPLTFRLQRQRTEKYTKTTSGSAITYAYNSGTNKQDDGFNYDLIGNIVNIFHRVTDCGIGGTPDALDREFDYDAIYRLTYADGRESNTQSGNTYLYNDAPAPSAPLPSNVQSYSRTYDYDKLGNIMSVVQSGTNGFTRNYTYNSGVNTLQKLEDSTPSTIESYTYDSCGNTITSNTNRYYYWNHADQLICYKNGSGTPSVYTQYDYSGQNRVSKLVKTGSNYERTIYIDGIFEYVKLETGTTYEKNYIHIMDDKSRIAEVRINPGTAFPGDITDDVTYHLEDQIGSSSARLSTTATIIDREEYYPFGDSSLRTFTYKRYRYVGKEKDSESGLYYYGARYYAAWTCRFISVDPLVGHYMYLSSYNYANNNPINDYDIDGKQDNESKKDSPPNQNNNTGNLVIVIKKEGDPKLNSKELKDYASGWDVVQVKDFSEAKEWIKNNYQVDGKATEIKNLVIATHAIPQGGKDYSLIVGEKKYGFNSEVTAKTLDERAIKGPSDFVKGKVINYAKDQLSALQSIIKENTNSTATIVLAGCELGRANNASNWAAFLNAGGDRTVFLNTDRTTFGGTAKVGDAKDKSFIIKSLNMTDMKEFANGTASGWIKNKFNVLTGGSLEKTQGVVLLFDGKNGKLVENRVADYRKK